MIANWQLPAAPGISNCYQFINRSAGPADAFAIIDNASLPEMKEPEVASLGACTRSGKAQAQRMESE